MQNRGLGWLPDLACACACAQGMDGKRGSMCTDTGRFQGTRVGCNAPLACEAMIGPLLHSGYGYCTDLGLGKFGMTGAMRAALVSQRRAAGGVPCRLPLFYKCGPGCPVHWPPSAPRMFFCS